MNIPPASTSFPPSASRAGFRPETPSPATADDPSRTERSPAGSSEERLRLAALDELIQRDREVRAHEQAHAAAGGGYAGAPSYTYSRGPDGRLYAVGGEVGIDTAPVPGDPAATLRKMEVVQRAALAPAEPSAQDLQIAAEAQVQVMQARLELAVQQREESTSASAEETAEKEAEPSQQAAGSGPKLDLYRRLQDDGSVASVVDLYA